jgi:Na+-transporting methylmalonyl-CoA/oxaloacetate decarboxylase gamma subunit
MSLPELVSNIFSVKEKNQMVSEGLHTQTWFWLLLFGFIFFLIGAIINELNSNVSANKGRLNWISLIFLGLGTVLIFISLIWYIVVYFSNDQGATPVPSSASEDQECLRKVRASRITLKELSE